MNIHTPEITAIPERDEAEAALALLRRWAKSASTTEILELDPSVARLVPGSDTASYPAFERRTIRYYISNFDTIFSTFKFKTIY